jgi:hypothetical protein
MEDKRADLMHHLCVVVNTVIAEIEGNQGNLTGNYLDLTKWKQSAQQVDATYRQLSDDLESILYDDSYDGSDLYLEHLSRLYREFEDVHFFDGFCLTCVKYESNKETTLSCSYRDHIPKPEHKHIVQPKYL